MKWINVSSSRVSGVAYDANNKKAHVKFKNGGSVYVYEGVSEKTFKQFIGSPSIGKAIPLLGNKYKRVQ